MLRRTPIRRKRSKPRRGKDTDEVKAEVRHAVYERAQGRCELRLVPECSKDRILPESGVTPWDHAHACHVKSAGAGGRWTMDNILLGCHACHLVGLHNPKPVPPK